MLHSMMLLVTAVLGTSAPFEKPPLRVGMISISGNYWTPDAVIRDQFPLYPGQVLDDPGLRSARHRLRRLHWLGISATVRVNDFEGQSDFPDILIVVEETPVTYFLIGFPHEIRTYLLERSSRP